MDLNNGVKMPALGLGVFLSPPEQTAEAVRMAIESGYRLVDTAAVYGNERQVGEGIRSSGIARAEMFVTTKLWITDYGYEPALRRSPQHGLIAATADQATSSRWATAASQTTAVPEGTGTAIGTGERRLWNRSMATTTASFVGDIVSGGVASAPQDRP